MAERIVIHPVTRVEGHAKISIYLDDSGEVFSAQFHVTEFRGFENCAKAGPSTKCRG
jgi:NAD-reducing hydrogenase large subunit